MACENLSIYQRRGPKPAVCVATVHVCDVHDRTAVAEAINIVVNEYFPPEYYPQGHFGSVRAKLFGRPTDLAKNDGVKLTCRRCQK